MSKVLLFIYISIFFFLQLRRTSWMKKKYCTVGTALKSTCISAIISWWFNRSSLNLNLSFKDISLRPLYHSTPCALSRQHDSVTSEPMSTTFLSSSFVVKEQSANKTYNIHFREAILQKCSSSLRCPLRFLHKDYVKNKSVNSLYQNIKFRTYWWKSSNILTCLSICSLIWSVIVVNKSFYIDFLLSIWQEIYLKQMWLTVIGWNCVTW
jgi:hypothetical protein